jgi:hypothetical protein
MDYGTDEDTFANVREAHEWNVPDWVGVMIRACDKVRRLKTFRRTGKLKNEGVEDAFLDLSNYALIARALFLEEEQKGE